jgi:hypothetical protein
MNMQGTKHEHWQAKTQNQEQDYILISWTWSISESQLPYQHRPTLEKAKKRHKNQLLANSHDTSPQGDAEQNPQLHSGVTPPKQASKQGERTDST